jgi:hypothetical protein
VFVWTYQQNQQLSNSIFFTTNQQTVLSAQYTSEMNGVKGRKQKQQQILPPVLHLHPLRPLKLEKARRQNKPSDPLLALVSRHHYWPPNLTPPYPRLAIIFYHCVHACSTPRLPIPPRFHAKDFSFFNNTIYTRSLID